MNKEVISKLNQALELGKKVAFVTLTEENGSSPGRVGDSILVYEDGTLVGTCGGGLLEHTIQTKALACLKNEESTEFSINLKEIGMSCGGSVRGFIDCRNRTTNLLVIGGGHLGKYIYQFSQILGYSVTIMDDREQYANSERFPNAKIICGDYGKVFTGKNYADSYIIIVSRGHGTDYVALKSLIKKDFKYLGLLGSKRKIISLLEKLKKDDIDYSKINNFYTPIGLNIAVSDPAEIAMSILAELMVVKNNGKLEHLSRVEESCTLR